MLGLCVVRRLLVLATRCAGTALSTVGQAAVARLEPPRMMLPNMRRIEGIVMYQSMARLAFTLGFILLAAGAAACSGTTAAPRQSAGGAAPIGGPKVDRLIIGAPPPLSQSHHAALMATSPALWLNPMWEHLLGLSPEGKELTPMLASQWTLEPDGTAYRFTLQQGVPFQNGKGGFTAKDVVFSLDDTKNEREPVVAGVTRMVRAIRAIEVVSDSQFILRMTEPNAGLLLQLSGAENVLPIRSKVDGESRPAPTLAEPPLASTGPYQWMAEESGQYYRYKKAVDKHWRQTPEFPELEFRFIKENSTILAALLAKEIHIALLPPEMMPQAEKSGFKAVAGKGPGQHVFLAMFGVHVNKKNRPADPVNPDANAAWLYPNSPLLNVGVRKALNKAIDRDAINKAFFRGKAEPVYNQWFHPTRPGWNPAWQQNFPAAYGYDVNATKQLLQEAGYNAGKPLKITLILRTQGFSPWVADLIDSLNNSWRAVGIDVKLDQIDQATFLNRWNKLEYEDALYANVTSVRALAGIGTFQSQSGRAGAESPDLDAIYAQLVKTLDPKAADELWRKWGEIAYQQYVNVPLFWIESELAIDTSVVAEYIFPGSVTGVISHTEYIKAAR